MHVGLSLFIRAAQTHNMHGQQRRWEFCMQPPPPCLILLHSLWLLWGRGVGGMQINWRTADEKLLLSNNTTKEQTIKRCSVVLLNLVTIHTWTSSSSDTWHHHLYFFQAEPLRKAGKDFKLLFVAQWSLTEFLIHNNLPAEHFQCFSQSLMCFWEILSGYCNEGRTRRWVTV